MFRCTCTSAPRQAESSVYDDGGFEDEPVVTRRLMQSPLTSSPKITRNNGWTDHTPEASMIENSKLFSYQWPTNNDINSSKRFSSGVLKSGISADMKSLNQTVDISSGRNSDIKSSKRSSSSGVKSGTSSDIKSLKECSNVKSGRNSDIKSSKRSSSSGVKSGTMSKSSSVKSVSVSTNRQVKSPQEAGMCRCIMAPLPSDQWYPVVFLDLENSLYSREVYARRHRNANRSNRSQQQRSRTPQPSSRSQWTLATTPPRPMTSLEGTPSLSIPYTDGSGTGEQRTAYQPYVGLLQLAAYPNHGMLTVHIVRARQLCHPRNPAKLCSSYVKVSISPDATKRARCKTSTVTKNNSPFFDEKFSFELIEGDLKRRLLVSLWHRDSKGSELIGCMSFSIKHIIQGKTVVQGWYFLLSDLLGHEKHMAARTIHQHSEESPHSPHLPVTPQSPQSPGDSQFFSPQLRGPPDDSLNSSNQKHDSTGESSTLGSSQHENDDTEYIQLHIKKGSGGFGFTMEGSGPAWVKKIRGGSSCEDSGLKLGDQLIKVNGKEVEDMVAEELAKFIRSCDGDLTVLIRRPTHTPDLLLGLQNQPVGLPWPSPALPQSPTSPWLNPAYDMHGEMPDNTTFVFEKIACRQAMENSMWNKTAERIANKNSESTLTETKQFTPTDRQSLKRTKVPPSDIFWTPGSKQTII